MGEAEDYGVCLVQCGPNLIHVIPDDADPVALFVAVLACPAGCDFHLGDVQLYGLISNGLDTGREGIAKQVAVATDAGTGREN